MIPPPLPLCFPKIKKYTQIVVDSQNISFIKLGFFRAVPKTLSEVSCENQVSHQKFEVV
jgi:hypothetical protein